MFDRVKQWYHRRKNMKDVIQRIQGVLSELSRYLSEFFDEGKEWIKKGASGARDEYKYFVNTRCHQAKFINEQVKYMQKSFKTSMTSKSFEFGMVELEHQLEAANDLITQSAHMVPYSRLDEFHLFIYNTLTNTLTDITRIYHNHVLE